MTRSIFHWILRHSDLDQYWWIGSRTFTESSTQWLDYNTNIKKKIASHSDKRVINWMFTFSHVKEDTRFFVFIVFLFDQLSFNLHLHCSWNLKKKNEFVPLWRWRTTLWRCKCQGASGQTLNPSLHLLKIEDWRKFRELQNSFKGH